MVRESGKIIIKLLTRCNNPHERKIIIIIILEMFMAKITQNIL